MLRTTISRRMSVVLLPLLLLVLSCSRKLDQPDLKPINMPKVAGLDSIYYVNIGDTLRINPQLTGGEANLLDTSRYLVEWSKLKDNQTDSTYRSNDLQYVPNLDDAGNSTWYYRITDKKLGVFTQQQFEISVVIPTQAGWYVLSDIGNNSSRLDMLSYNVFSGYAAIPDIIGKMGSTYQLRGKPRSVDFAYTLMALPQVATIVITDQDAVFLDPDGLSIVGKVEDDFSLSSNFSPATYNGIYSFYAALLNVGGQLYYSDGDLFGDAAGPVPRSATDNSPMHISPLFACSTDYFYMYNMDMILFDMDSQSFLRSQNLYYSSSYPVFMGKGELFNFQIKKKLMALTYTGYNGGEFYAVLEDNDTAAYYLAIFKANGSQRYFAQLNVIGIDQADHFAVGTEFGYLFYTVGSQVYEFDAINQVNKMVADLGDKQISYIGIPTFPISINGDSHKEDLSRKLLICSYDAADQEHSGTIGIYNIPAANAPLQLKESYTGFGKIVSLSYRENIE
ncbi:PKD-like family protein [Chitinophaga costaii]|uniref:PKD-like family protein n=1 Tax=Chitinophaga costaii TaxID=1335309 RepID=A0A1C4BKN6_9BACT|nr:PKD-like family lipoprotein [Chitinophaga costaii]SCC07242.1 PKD-like family protein [Chitinophaga costaii]